MIKVFLCGAAIIAIMVPAVNGASFGPSAKGSTAATFLKLGAGARAAGMGEAFTAVVDDATALCWNPAGLTRIQNRSVSLYSAHDSSYYSHAAFGQKLSDRHSWGLGVQYMSAGKIVETDDTGTEIGSFSPNDLALSLGYAARLGGTSQDEGFSVGVVGKYIKSTILQSAQTLAADIGILSPRYFDAKLGLALAAANVGGTLRYETQVEDLPLIVKLGSELRLKKNFSTSLELWMPRDNRPIVAAGTEYRLAVDRDWAVSGRAGFNSRTVGDVTGFTGCSFGLGLAMRTISLDYAFTPVGGLGIGHKFSLSTKW